MPRGVRQTTAMYIRSQTIIFSPISDNRVCVVQPMAAGALAGGVLPQHAAARLCRPRHVPRPRPHPRTQRGHGRGSHAPGPQVIRSKCILLQYIKIEKV